MNNGPNASPLTLSQKRALPILFNQHWENARHIKNERLSFTNIYAIIAAGVLSLLHSIRGDFVLEVSLIGFLCVFSSIGLLSSLRLKAELEECMRNIERVVGQMAMEQFMPMMDSQGALTRYPKFRWLFPLFFAVTTAGFSTLLMLRIFF